MIVLAMTGASASAAALPDKVSFNQQVRPILSNNCFYCHGPDEKHRDGKLRFDIREDAVRDLGGYSAIVPGKPDESELIKRITTHDEDDIMPPLKSKKHLAPQEIEVLRRWIAQGAEYEGHWAFLPLRTMPSPAVKDSAWCKTGVDRFILERLEREGIAPSPEADRATLIRRVHLDLTGLLPTPEEVDAFVKDPAPDAYERLVEKLLASPHYGERWGRHWLDQARYADSNGYSIDAARAMWPYRDWVIKALNDDMPFDRFTIEQIAGDLLPKPTKSELVATAFHRNTLINQEGGSDPEQFRVEAVIDRVNTTGQVWLGLTVGCAQCHTHKFDPITQREFYQMFAFFNSGEDRNSTGATVTVSRGEMFGGPPPPADPKAVSDAEIARLKEAWEKKELARQETAGAKANAKLLTALRQIDAARDAGLRKIVQAAFEKAEPRASKKRVRGDDLDATTVEQMIMRDLPKPRETFLFQRGDFLRPDTALGVLQPGFIQAASTAMPEALRTPRSALRNRLDLARWLVNPANPLTPRVTMNRVWMHYFGRGIVETEEDFGTQGSLPTHPELLDWLAREFIRSGWSMKAMHRLIVNSATYRQSSNARPDLAEKDPRNLLLARQERLRVDAEIVRDAALSASGLLDATIGGPGVRPPQPEGVYAFTQTGKKWATSPGTARFRRAMYTIFYRSAPYPIFGTFDAPNFQNTCTRRPRSDTPLQSLTLANDPAFMEMAQGLALRMMDDTPGDDLDARLRCGFRLCMSREPSAKEFAILHDYATAQAADLKGDATAANALLNEALKNHGTPAENAALVLAARLLLNTDNFITRE
ncbi:MAG: PSD1 and planctomycete cytochrome C domain-containing protein [Chthoniobacteraceae bacterium]